MSFKKPPVLSEDEVEKRAQEFIMNSPSNKSFTSIKLIADGTLDRQKAKFSTKNIALHSRLEEEINTSCRGSIID